MEKKLRLKIDEYTLEFKKNIKSFINDNEHLIVDKNGKDITNTALEFIYDFRSLDLSKDDFQKRKRTKNIIPNYERCCALRLNGERCTRKKKDKDEFCGTHLKGKPYGIVEESQVVEKTKIAIWVEEIGGIHQYVDETGNIYATEDILQSVKQPRVIGKK
uniref:Uncharacterized protein n=1 Tax=viral metagenome TaxID=1070528 RepID=A0A6C0EUU1_9ZZZZ